MSTLHLKSIQLEQFRQYSASTTIDGLDNGLCIIAGSNEAGKSTLLQAIRAALFDRYKSSVGEQFRPYGAAVSPSVGITFALDGVEYRLSKVFSKKKDGEAVLEFTADKGKERKEGDEAEDYLAELLGFEFSKKGGSRAELQGLAGLLWVDQSKASESVDLTDNTRRRVQSVFEHEMRDLLGGESGDAVQQRITQMWGEFFGKNGPIGAYRKLSESLDELSSDVDGKYTALEEYEKKVDQLESTQKDLQTYQDDNSLEVSKKRLEEAKAAVQQIAGLRGAVEQAKSGVELKESRFNLAEKEYTTRSKTIEELKGGENEATELDQKSANIALKLQSAEEEALERTKALEVLKQSQLEKDEQLMLASQIDELDGLSTEKATWDDKLKGARAIDTLRREAVSSRDAISLIEDDLKELRIIRHNADLAQAKMEAAATSLIYDLDNGKSALLDDKQIDGSGTTLLSEPTSLDVSEIGRFLIKPGGEELETHRSVIADNESRLRQKLAGLSLKSLEVAEDKWHEKLKFGEAAELHQATLEGMAPEGISAIEDKVSTVQAKMVELEEKLGDNKDLELDTASLQTELSELKDQITAQEDAVREHAPLVNQLREDVAAVGAEKKALQRHIDAARNMLEQARKETGDDQLLTAYTSTKADFGTAKEQLDNATAALEAENPDVIDSELERAERVVTDMERDIQSLNQEIRDLKVELSALGQKGLSEELAEAEGNLALAQLEFDIADKQAKALDLLKRTLDESLKSAKEVAAKPITEKLIPYLKQLIPEANPLVDENMVLTGIERAGTREPFEDLSIGTREQLAVLIRLAYADLLSEANQPITVILDDALVNSDDERRDRMKAILFQASKRYQIIILTCHGREYRDAGGQFIRLEERAA